MAKASQNIKKDYSILILMPLRNSSRYKPLLPFNHIKGYHVQITARSETDLDPATIMNKVADSSGSKYSDIMSKFETSPQSKRSLPISPSVV